ncbi:PEP-CTERM sorting domain-containing protein [Ruficoccus sp. ZRK36]|uniref:PEP-CTERM sorting domain-containing protein n=1 Tax=Ruficoccus sp. ZRK36 TaxID=2866311 RepID=UPI001C731CC0|nr:PEP-CTERM sorting domain-containing protein [Ruficoccus sp. ZRK36]QYY34442.1 PEP-CTERM sorting domain-containing protein [Ruficoccus sp. ZRK36]
MRFATLSFFALSVLCPLASAEIPVLNYSYSTSPSGSYPDSGGTELTDGVDETVAWGSGMTIDGSDAVPLVGWLNNNASITFNFSEEETIRSVTVWAADSDNYAGVGLPATITLSTPGEAFSQTFNVVNPAGNGTTIPLTFSGFSVTTDQFVVSFTRASQWTMLSEVEFSDVPEPAHVGAVLALGALLWVGVRRQRKQA